MALKDYGSDAAYNAKLALLGPNAGNDMALSAMWDKLAVPYQVYDDPGTFRGDDAIVSPYAFSDGKIPVFDGQTFKLVSGGQTAYEGAGIDALREATRLSQDLGGDWRIVGSLPGADPDAAAVNALFNSDAPAGIGYGGKSKSDFDPKFLIGALPMLAAVAAPAIGAALGGAGGGAAGAGAAGAAGAGAGAAGAAGGLGAGAGLGGAAAAGAAGIGGSIANAAALAPLLAGATAPITVIGATGAGLGGLGAGLGAAGLAGAGAAALGGSGAGALPGDIVVTGNPNPPPLNLDPLGPPIGVGGAATGALNGGTGSVTQQAPKSTMDKIIDYLQLGGLASGFLGNLFGGGGQSGNGTVPGGLDGALNPLFSKTLPTGTIPGTAGGALGARTMPAQDWERYAMRPEQSFFNYVPQGYTPPAQGVKDERYDKGFAVGGDVSTGRSDDISARLSDGEYVIDAETVALLGDGSSKAGADVLDAFRVNVRKHKGRDLAKGRFSAKAKAPERYMRDE